MSEWLIGKQRHTIDDKNRTFIPAKFRTKLGDTIYVTKSFSDKCLCLYSEEGFKRFKDQIVGKLPKVKGAAVISWLGRNSEELTVDGQGRIALPADYRKFAGLDKNIVSSGAFDYVELWDEETFDAKEAAMDLSDVRALLESSEDAEMAK
ncbi:MAG: division/cell wall cluster transcriptional repressor MraZ [Eubacteriales bacterium]